MNEPSGPRQRSRRAFFLWLFLSFWFPCSWGGKALKYFKHWDLHVLQATLPRLVQKASYAFPFINNKRRLAPSKKEKLTYTILLLLILKEGGSLGWTITSEVPLNLKHLKIHPSINGKMQVTLCVQTSRWNQLQKRSQVCPGDYYYYYFANTKKWFSIFF